MIEWEIIEKNSFQSFVRGSHLHDAGAQIAITILKRTHMATTTLPEAEVQPVSKSATKYVYFFGGSKADGNGKMKDELGGKGAGLAEMTNAALPVPPGFTIQTAACREFMKTGKVSDALERQMKDALARLEELQKQKLGAGENPLLVSVR